MATWYFVISVLLILMVVTGSFLKRMPLNSSIIYLLAGVLLGPSALNLLEIDLTTSAQFLEHFSEFAVIVSLFTAGLKLRFVFFSRRWTIPFRLATLTMFITTGAIAALGVLLFDLPLGAAILLGAVLAPTDPVLASEVQVSDERDNDRLRFALTGEAGFNDGAAFPFVMLGLGLLGYRDLGAFGLRWIGTDLLWATTAGLGVGAFLGWGIGRFVLYLRKNHREAVGYDDFLTLGLIGLSYSLAHFISAYGFLAVFSAGLALRRVEFLSPSGEEQQKEGHHANQNTSDEVSEKNTPAYMANAVLEFNKQIERLGEVAVMLVVGTLLTKIRFDWMMIPMTFLILFVIRPFAVWCGLLGHTKNSIELLMLGWFGIRGIGSIYYLYYALNQGLAQQIVLAENLVSIVLCVIGVSVVLHGVSVTPLMRFYKKNVKIPESQKRGLQNRCAPR